MQNNWIILKGYLSNQCTDSCVRGTQLSQALAPWFNIGNRCPVAIMPCTCQPTDFLATTDRNINLFWRFLSMSTSLAIDVHLKFQAIIVSWNKFQIHHWNYHGAPNKYGLKDDGFFFRKQRSSHLPWIGWIEVLLWLIACALQRPWSGVVVDISRRPGRRVRRCLGSLGRWILLG